MFLVNDHFDKNDTCDQYITACVKLKLATVLKHSKISATHLLQ